MSEQDDQIRKIIEMLAILSARIDELERRLDVANDYAREQSERSER